MEERTVALILCALVAAVSIVVQVLRCAGGLRFRAGSIPAGVLPSHGDVLRTPFDKTFRNIWADRVTDKSAAWWNTLGSAPPTTPFVPPVAVRSQVRDRLVKIYRAHRPDKIVTVDGLLTEWHGDEWKLLQEVMGKYSVPESFFTADEADTQQQAAEANETEHSLASEQAEQARLVAEQEQQRLAAEQEQQRLAAEERLAAEKAERVRLAAEKAEQQRLAAEQEEQQRVAAEREERERAVAEDAERARLAAEKEAQERLVAEKAEQQRFLAANKARQERLAAEKAKQWRDLAAKKAEEKRLVAERAEQERLAAETAEQERLAADAAAMALLQAEVAEAARAVAAQLLEEAEQTRSASCSTG